MIRSGALNGPVSLGSGLHKCLSVSSHPCPLDETARLEGARDGYSLSLS